MRGNPATAARNDPWFEALARVSDTGVMMFDPDGTPQFVSGLARQLLRCENDHEVELAIIPLVDSVASANQICSEAGFGEEMAPQRTEFLVESSDGSHRVSAIAHAIRTEDCVGVLVLLWDKDREILMQKDLRMASRFRNVGQLYQAMAHDLRSPVGSIIMASSLIRSIGDLALKPKSEEANQFTQWIEAIDEASTTLEQSLNLILGELISIDEHQEEFPVSEVVDAVGKLIAPQTRRANISLSLALGSGVGWISGSPARLKLALLNVATNSIQAMPNGGSLRIEAEKEDSYAVITIADTGPGIAKDQLKRIFERYYTTKSSGTGIGLHITSEIVEQHDGSIEVRSEVGEGTSVLIRLPICESRLVVHQD